MAQTKDSRELAQEMGAEIDAQRAADSALLAQLGNLHAVMQTFLQHETLRVETKAGARNPYAIALREAEVAGVDEIGRLNAEFEISRIRVPAVGDDDALVHGRVLDGGGRGLPGLVVCLVHRGSAPLAGVDPATADASGYYAVAIDADAREKAAQGKTVTAAVAVFDASGRPLHRDKKALELGPGARHRIEIVLDRKGGAGPTAARRTAPRPAKSPTKKATAPAKKRAKKKAPERSAFSKSPTPAVVDTVVAALVGTVGFAEIGASAGKLRRRLAAMEVGSPAAAAALLERADDVLRDALGLGNLRSARAFKRSLAIVVRDLGHAPGQIEP